MSERRVHAADPQLDLFAAPPPAASVSVPRQSIAKYAPGAVPEQPRYLALLPGRPAAWQRLLDRAAPHPVELMVAIDWTGVVVETLSDLQLGRHYLFRTGEIVEYAPDTVPKRVVFFTPATLRQLASKAPIAVLRPGGTDGFVARFALDGEAPGAELDELLARLERRQ